MINESYESYKFKCSLFQLILHGSQQYSETGNPYGSPQFLADTSYFSLIICMVHWPKKSNSSPVQNIHQH